MKTLALYDISHKLNMRATTAMSFLEEKGIKPVFERKFGRGVSRYYDRSLVWPAIKEELERRKAEQAEQRAEQPAPQPEKQYVSASPICNRLDAIERHIGALVAAHMDIAEKQAKLEAMLKRIIDDLTTAPAGSQVLNEHEVYS